MVSTHHSAKVLSEFRKRITSVGHKPSAFLTFASTIFIVLLDIEIELRLSGDAQNFINRVKAVKSDLVASL